MRYGFQNLVNHCFQNDAQALGMLDIILIHSYQRSIENSRVSIELTADEIDYLLERSADIKSRSPSFANYLQGACHFLKGNIAQAIPFLNRAINLNNDKAMYLRAHMFQFDLIKPNFSKAIKLYDLAIYRGNVYASAARKNIDYNEEHVSLNQPTANRMLRRRAIVNDPLVDYLVAAIDQELVTFLTRRPNCIAFLLNDHLLSKKRKERILLKLKPELITKNISAFGDSIIDTLRQLEKKGTPIANFDALYQHMFFTISEKYFLNILSELCRRENLDITGMKVTELLAKKLVNPQVYSPTPQELEAFLRLNIHSGSEKNAGNKSYLRSQALQTKP